MRKFPANGIARDVLHGWLARTAGFLAFWVILSGLNPADLPVGVLAAVIATWSSLRLLPPGRWSFRPIALTQLVLRFLRQSVGAGIDVAWRALDPRLPLRPGFVVYPVRFPPGPARNVFTTLTSLLPGTVPAGRGERTAPLPLPRCRPAGGGAAGRGGSGCCRGRSGRGDD